MIHNSKNCCSGAIYRSQNNLTVCYTDRTMKIPFTQSGYDELIQEQTRLQEKRKETVVSLSRAREMGDLSENGLYKAAKMELGGIDRRLRQINYLLRFASIVE